MQLNNQYNGDVTLVITHLSKEEGYRFRKQLSDVEISSWKNWMLDFHSREIKKRKLSRNKNEFKSTEDLSIT